MANYSYHVPSWSALRLWSTAVIEESGNQVLAVRRTGPSIVQSAIEQLPSVYGKVRRHDPNGSLWLPIYRVRAGICWQLKAPEAVFNKALHQVLARDTDSDIAFGINLEKAQYGNVPPTELPLRLNTKRGVQTYYAMSLVPETKDRQSERS